MSSDESGSHEKEREEDEDEEVAEKEPEGDDIDDDDEEEEEEGQDEYDRTDGWLVDEEDEKEEEHDSEEEARKERKRKKKRERQEELDDDDYELLEEAGAIRSRHVPKEGDKKFKRLKKARRVGGTTEGSYQVEDEEEEDGAEPQTAEERLKHSLFGYDEGINDDVLVEDAVEPDEVEEEEEMGDEDEMDGFIVDETDENGDPVRRRRAKKKSRGQYTTVMGMALQEAKSIFGDVSDLLDALAEKEREKREEEEGPPPDEELDEEGYPRARPVVTKTLMKTYEPSILESKYMTERDEEIRVLDVPERLQLLEEVVGPLSGKENKLQEAEWIFDRVFGVMAIPHRPEFAKIKTLEEKARSLQKEAAEKARSEAASERQKAVQQIASVLTHMHEKKLEVPFIGMHRKKLCPSLLGMDKEDDHPRLQTFEALWAIQQMDCRWRMLQRRKSVLKAAYERPRSDPDEYVDMQEALGGILNALDEAQTEQAVEDVDAKVNLQFPPEEAVVVHGTKQFRRPRKRSLYSECRKAGIGQVTKYFGLTAYKFGENLQSLYKSVVSLVRMGMMLAISSDNSSRRFHVYSSSEPCVVARDLPFAIVRKHDLLKALTLLQLGAGKQLHEVDDEAKSPEEVAAEHTTSAFKDPQAVLKAARHMIEVEIGVEPGVRDYVRSVFMERAVVQTRPTQKGEEAIDAFHRYAGVKWLLNKPVMAFEDEQWLLIAKAEEEGLLSVKLELPPDVVEKTILHDFENAFLSDRVSLTAQLWNDQRKQILRGAVNGRLLPFLAREMKNTLSGRARQILADQYAGALWKKVSISPYGLQAKQSFLEAHDGSPWLRVMACCWGPGDPATTMVMLSPSGEITDYIHTGFLTLRTSSTEQQQRKVGTEQQQRKQTDVERLRHFMLDQKPHVVVLGAANLNCRKLKDELFEAIWKIQDEHPKMMAREVECVDVCYEDETLAQLYENSAVSLEQLPGQPGIVRRAVALGRLMQNRMAVVASLCGHNREILSAKLHPLQDLLSDDDRYEAVERVMMTVTNQVGIDVNMAAQHEWLFSPLQFVCGLGPRKASILQRRIRGEGLLHKRRDLIDNGWLGRTVFVNMASAMRIRGQDDPLDDTRIHPETYELAQKMALEAYCDSERMRPEEVESRELDVVSEIRENPSIIQGLDLSGYAEEMRERGLANDYPVLLHIKRELMAGYREWREPYKQPNEEEEFYMLSGETRETLAEGRIVQATVKRLQSRRVFCVLESGLAGMIDKNDLSDDPEVDPMSYISEGSVVMCRVKEIKPAEYQVDLTCKGSDLRSDYWKERRQWDTYYVRDPSILMTDEEKAKKKAAEVKEKQKKTFQPRGIKFPLFQNISMLEATQQLESKEIGDVIIRPSSKGPSNLSLTLKFYDGIYTHIDIVEGGKDRRDVTSFLRLGKTLTIGEETYEDLDEVVARYVDPLVNHLREMVNYRKFRRGTKGEIDDVLRQEKMDNPGRVPYYISVSYDHAGAFLLAYIRSSSPIHEYITVNANGFRYRKKTFSSPERLIKYFQEHFHEPIPEAPRRHVTAPLSLPLPPRSPAPRAWGNTSYEIQPVGKQTPRGGWERQGGGGGGGGGGNYTPNTWGGGGGAGNGVNGGNGGWTPSRGQQSKGGWGQEGKNSGEGQNKGGGGGGWGEDTGGWGGQDRGGWGGDKGGRGGQDTGGGRGGGGWGEDRGGWGGQDTGGGGGGRGGGGWGGDTGGWGGQETGGGGGRGGGRGGGGGWGDQGTGGKGGGGGGGGWGEDKGNGGGPDTGGRGGRGGGGWGEDKGGWGGQDTGGGGGGGGWGNDKNDNDLGQKNGGDALGSLDSGNGGGGGGKEKAGGWGAETPGGGWGTNANENGGKAQEVGGTGSGWDDTGEGWA